MPQLTAVFQQYADASIISPDCNRPRQAVSAETRAKISHARRTSPAALAANAARTGVPRSKPHSPETRARMSASKHAQPGTRAWQNWHDYYLNRQALEEALSNNLAKLERLSGSS